MKIVFLLSALILIPIIPAFSEEYNYMEVYRLFESPLYCAYEFDDLELPQANQILMEKTEQAVLEWESKLVEHTGNSEAWDFSFRTITLEEQENFFSDLDCTVILYYEREAPTDEQGQRYAGETFVYFGFSDITIFYLERIWEPTGETVDINGEIMDEIVVTRFGTEMEPNVDDTIKHEIGHSLGLDHPKFELAEFEIDSQGILHSPSIMVSTENILLPIDTEYEIMDYDVRSVVNLYGDEGFEDPISLLVFDIVGYLIIVGIIALIIFLVERRRKRKRLEFH